MLRETTKIKFKKVKRPAIVLDRQGDKVLLKIFYNNKFCQNEVLFVGWFDVSETKK